MPILQLVVLEAEAGAGSTPFLVAGAVLLGLFAALLGILAFGKGREHS
jgi:hypothetical protein